jgi:NAD(P)-dependent dehydrogenase (short-subunit alcohol dehydrogenase family)
MKELSNTVAVVTGGHIGLGRALAVEAARRGAAVVIASPSDASSTVEQIRATGATAEWARVDVPEYAAVEGLAHSIRTLSALNLPSPASKSTTTDHQERPSCRAKTADTPLMRRSIALCSLKAGGAHSWIRSLLSEMPETAPTLAMLEDTSFRSPAVLGDYAGS